MLAFLSPRKLPPIPTGSQAPAADSKLTESPEELSPPRPLDGSNYPATPSLTSSDASIASTDPQPTPPNTAEQGRLATGGTDRGRKHPREPNSPLRNSLTPPATPVPAPRKESASPTTPEQPRSRPPRPPLPPTLGGPDPNDANPHAQDGLSIISRTTYFTQRSVAAKPRTRTTSTFLRDCHDSWVYVLCSRPKVLAGLLQYIDFAEFHALCCTSKPMRDILDIDQAVRDVILSRFVPGYRCGAAMPAGHQDIRVDLRDLEALMLSQAIPLHIYPQHALDIISGLPPTESSGQLQHFTNVHSRFVLLLRSRAPAWSLLPELADDPVWRLGSTPDQWPNLRELTFPAPLSYPDPSVPTKEKGNRPSPSRSSSITSSKKQQCLKPIISFFSSRGSSGRRNHAPSYPVSHPRHPTGGRSDTYPVYSAHIRPDGVREDGIIASTLLRRSSKMPPPPPPEYTPKALKDYRRRSRISNSYSLGSRQTQLHRLSEHFLEDDTAPLTPPRPAHLRANSLPASVSSSSSLGRRRGSASPTLAGVPVGGGSSLASPHDLVMAATKSKAPVCRIFVPSEDMSGSTLLACEGQLVSAGLWKYLKTGDIVCNLGYIPATDDKPKSITSGGTGGTGEQWSWLVYNGESLVPYQPSQPPANLNAFELPSPMYYTHIIPSFAINPRFFVIIPPVPEGTRKRQPDLTLTQLSSSMPSPATKSGLAGFARVKHFAWVGRVDGAEILASWRSHAGDELNADFFGFCGDGWATQWVVEAEGTKEGKAGLLEALDPSVGGDDTPATEWELVRDKCTPGRLWLRLIIIPPPTESTDELGQLGAIH